MPPVITLHRRFAKLEPVAKVMVLHLCRKLCRGLSRKMPDPTKVATKAADKVLSSADFCNGLQPGIGPRRRCWLVAPRQRSNRTQRMYRKFSVKVPVLLGLICFVTVFTWVAG